MSGISIGNLPNQSILKKINDIEADVKDLDLEGVNNLKSKLSELVAPELGSSDTKAISQKVVTENIQQLNTEVNNKINKVESAQNGNLPSFDNGHIKDSKIPASNIAQANGYYESMIVGASRNLAGNNIVTAKYTYRPTADTTDVADGVAKISSVKGNTIVWNQLCTQKNVNTKTNTKFIPLNKTIIAGHICYISCKRIVGNTDIYVNLANNHDDYDVNKCLVFKVNEFISKSIFIKADEDKSYVYIYLSNNTTEAQIDNIQVFDLTQMFGEGNEPTIEEFEAMFPNDYYEYNEGELKSIEDFQIKSVGFNQWNEEFVKKNTSINKYGIETVSDSFWSSQFVKVLPNTEYYIAHIPDIYYGYPIHEYDINFNHTTSHGITNITQHISNEDRSGRFVTNNNTCYLRFIGLNIVGYSNTCINLSHSGIRDGEYEPYQEDILPINISTIKDENGEQLFPNGLCSAREAHDELMYDKSLGKWKAVKRIGSVDMGSLGWNYNDGSVDPETYPYGFNQAILNNRKPGRATTLQVKYTYNNDFKKDKTFVSALQQSTIYIVDSSYTDANSFKQSLQGQILYYELAEPIEVVLDDFTSNYKVSDWGTEEILMNSTPIVPVIYDVEYALNAVDTLRNMPTNYISKESLDAFLSTLGSAMGGTWTATYNETNGRYDFSFSASATELIEE